ncbi:hypothetical protein [Shimia sp. SDUM112013]|uniref:hypothetical protein n=1 Tax=Shimia sp. SDUM112013 TaxID=3136160 RepID=UPI0032EC90C3
MLKRLSAALLLAATAAQAEPPFTCDGADPDWHLTLAGPMAQLRYLRNTDFEIPQSTRAEGRDWPRAYTLVSEFDTAIIILNEARCTVSGAQWPITAHVLTQRGTTPILLTGCCTVAE